MTKAKFILEQNLPTAFTISGHAGYGEYGEDIVCSSITTAVFTTLNLLLKFLQDEDYTLIQDEDKGLIDFKLLKKSDLTLTIIQNLLEILTNIEEQYPQNLKIILK